MNRTKYILVFKYAVYALLLLLLYVLQTVPGLFVLFGAKPVWVISCAIAIAMVEGEFVGGIFGALAGLFCDLGGFTLFGFQGFFFCIFCVLAGLLVIYLVHCNVWGCLLFVFLALLITESIGYFFSYGMWGYDHSVWIFLGDIFPRIIYSVAVAPLPYLIVTKLHKGFDSALKKA